MIRKLEMVLRLTGDHPGWENVRAAGCSRIVYKLDARRQDLMVASSEAVALLYTLE